MVYSFTYYTDFIKDFFTLLSKCHIINVSSFMLIRKAQPFLCKFRQNSHVLNSIMCKSLMNSILWRSIVNFTHISQEVWIEQ